MRVDDQRVRGLTLHLERLTRDCRRIFDADLDPDRVRHLLRHTLADTAGSVLVRVTVFDPDLELGRPGADAEPQLLVTTRPAATAPLPPLRLQSAPHCRELPEVKHVGLFGALRWRRVAQRNGFDDALFTDAGAAISEAATSNIGFVDGERIVWPEADCLAGVTMRLINKARQADATTTPVTLSDLAGVDAVFATNAVVGVRSVSAVDGIQWSDEHPVLDILRRQYAGVRPELL
ncbi:MAG: branched-chain amino acid aminotransferase/4-amino-4-deoxychorismate lyase [Pseudonocardiales bacterium]|nr:branched-chain amino acid aminotransferase/4-amino-4-deoxychorismate lyase [Pseudonocardiales bacterium]